MKFCIVNAEDWAGLYVEGQLVDEAHRISEDTLVTWLQRHGVDIARHQLSNEGEVDLMDGGGLPTLLSKVSFKGKKKP